MVLKAQNPHVLPVDVEKQAVGDIHRLDIAGTFGGESQHCVSAIVMLVHPMPDRPRRTIVAAGTNPQARQGICSNRAMARSQFTPGYVTVSVGIQSDRVLQIPQRDAPLDKYSRAGDAKRQRALVLAVG